MKALFLFRNGDKIDAQTTDDDGATECFPLASEMFDLIASECPRPCLRILVYFSAGAIDRVDFHLADPFESSIVEAGALSPSVLTAIETAADL